MEDNTEEKLQRLNNTFCELKIHKADDIEYIPVVREIDDILEKEPNNVSALQLKILIKTSYKIVPWTEVDQICHQLLKIAPKNKIAKRALDRKTYKYGKKKPIEIDFSLIVVFIIAVVCIIFLYKNWILLK